MCAVCFLLECGRRWKAKRCQDLKKSESAKNASCRPQGLGRCLQTSQPRCHLNTLKETHQPNQTASKQANEPNKQTAKIQKQTNEQAK